MPMNPHPGIANGGTFLGALCFFGGARLLLAGLAGADGATRSG
jgi:hypothetical protein